MKTKFYKIFLLAISLSFITPNFAFAGLGEITSGVKSIVRTTKDDSVNNKKEGGRGLLDKLNFASNLVVPYLQKFINNTMNVCIGFFNGKLNTVSDGRTNEGMVDVEHQDRGKDIEVTTTNAKNKFKAKGRSWSIFMVMVAIWLMMSCFYFCWRRFSDPNFQIREIPLILLKLLFIMLLFWISPKLADFFIQFAWWAAEIAVNGTSSVGTLSYSALITNIVNAGQLGWLSGILGGALALSIFTAGPFGVGFSGTAFGSISTLIFGLVFAGIAVSTMVSLMYCVWILELYLATWVLIMFLPATLFDGFGLKAMAALKFYFTNAMEVFVGAVLILLFKEIFSSINIVGDNAIIGLLDLLLKPLILLILFPAVSKICNAIVQGGGVADTSNTVLEAGKQVSGFMTAGHTSGLGKMAQGLENRGIGLPRSQRQQQAAQQAAQAAQQQGFQQMGQGMQGMQQQLQAFMNSHGGGGGGGSPSSGGGGGGSSSSGGGSSPGHP